MTRDDTQRALTRIRQANSLLDDLVIDAYYADMTQAPNGMLAGTSRRARLFSAKLLASLLASATNSLGMEC